MASSALDEVTPRESAVLAAVGRRLSNVEIASELYISVRTVESHIAALRRKLGAESRSALVAAALARRGTAVQLPQNSFVGRADDLEVLGALLERERWVTVVGAAGCGKTRLALELAVSNDGRVPVVVELEHTGPSDVVGQVARAVGLGTDSQGNTVAACGLALDAHRHLLVLDNCDRVTDAAAQMVGELLAQARSLVVVATSRAPLGGSDETVYPLAPLMVDGAGGAVRLFLDRAEVAAPTTALTAGNGDVVARICRRLDGLPLAIELAAARVRHLPVAELAARLEDGFGSLDRSGPSGRHRTLETAFDWTWDLLDDTERSVLARLAALPRTFDLALAEAVAGKGADRVLLRLLDRSLVSPTTKVEDPRRFRLLASLRAFVLERTDRGIVEEVRRAHALYHLDCATVLRQRARTDDSRELGDEAQRLCTEVNAAAGWAMRRAELDLVLPLVDALAVGGEQFGPDLGSVATIARAAREPQVRQAASTTQLLDLGIALCYGDLDLVDELAQRALEIATDPASELAAHHLAGFADAYRDRGHSALEHFAVAERLADELLDMWQLASVRQGRGIALRGPELDDPDAAMASFESAMHTFALAGDAMHVNNARYMMASTAASSGRRTDEARGWAEQCAVYARDTGNRHELAHAVLTASALAEEPTFGPELTDALDTFRNVGDLRCMFRSHILLARDHPPREQLPRLRQALDVARRAHDVRNQADALERISRVHWELGECREAALALGMLVAIVGEDAATARCPTQMVEELEQWRTAVAEGRARGLTPTRH